MKGAVMSATTALRKVQQKLNRLSLASLGMIMAKCGSDEKSKILRRQALLAMSTGLDSGRLNDDDSFHLVSELADSKWL